VSLWFNLLGGESAVFSRFFIDRPIFASVLSIVITLTGAVSVFTLPMAQYPPIAPPTIVVSCTYGGASAVVVSESIAAPIEQQVNGVENMLYMSSQCGNDGSYQLSVVFKPGVNLNFAQVLVQNRLNLALPLLPDVVKQSGVTTRKRSPDILLIVSIFSPGHTYDQLYLSNYALLQVRDELLRVDGVGDVFLFGQQDYSMRLWLDPDRLASRSISAGDVVAALRDQNIQVAAGFLGQEPAPRRHPFQYTVSTLGRLKDASEFADIVIKRMPDGRIVRIRDVGRAELAPKSQDITAKLDGDPCINVAIFQLPDANALDTADRLADKMEDLRKSFPKDVDFKIAYDTTPFVRESVAEVYNTLRDAVILVALVVLLFLQNWRSAIIPLVAVPVAIIGTFAVMAAIGFSLNNLTLFGLVLAIGIVVDDAIVVVEAVEHHIEHGLKPRAATIKAMEQVSGPVVAVALVLTAVFVPCAFITGITGEFFRQFALTIAVSTVISAFNSLTLSPALAALLLKPRHKDTHEALPRLGVLALAGWASYVLLGPQLDPAIGPWLRTHLGGLLPGGWADHIAPALPWTAAVLGGLTGWFVAPLVNWLMRGFFGLFNAGFTRATNAYTRLVGLGLRVSLLVLLLYAGLLGLTYAGFNGVPSPLLPAQAKGVKWGSFDLASGLPSGYIPTQDKGYLFVAVQLPDASALERTQEIIDRLDRICHDTEGVAHTIGIAGQSFVLGAYGPNFGQFFVTLKDFHERRRHGRTADVIVAELRRRCSKEAPEAAVSIFGPAPVSGLGTAGGFKIMIEDRGDLGLDRLQGQTLNLIDKANQQPALSGVFTVFRANAPQLYVDVNRQQCFTLGVQLRDVFDALQVYLGSLYVNDFNRFGRTWQVIVQAEAPFRNHIDAIKLLRVRGRSGSMVPLGSVCTIKEINGPLLLVRYNLYPAAAVQGNTAPGVSSGEAITIMEALCKQELPRAMTFEWTEITLIQVLSGNTAWILFVLAVVLVFLVLAAQYESWSLPLAVILVVPMCILGSIVGVAITKSDVNVFTQIGFVVLVGLASKNAILIVEFAKAKREQGEPARQAALEACQLRLRPILMTSLAFILGVVPLMLGTGAGAEMRQTLGTAVFSGMLGVTLFGLFLTPVFFYVVDHVGSFGIFSSPLFRRLNQAVLLISPRRWKLYLTPAVSREKWGQRPWPTQPPGPQQPPAPPAPPSTAIRPADPEQRPPGPEGPG
jgi:multidrug efflux pump subunit AcrB